MMWKLVLAFILLVILLEIFTHVPRTEAPESQAPVAENIQEAD